MPGLSPKMLLRNNLVKDRGGLHETMNLSVIDEVSREWDSSVDFGVGLEAEIRGFNMNELYGLMRNSMVPIDRFFDWLMPPSKAI